MALIFIGSQMSFEDSGTGFIKINDKVIHFTEYAVLGYLLIKYFNINHGKNMNRSASLSLLSGSLYAASDEIHQGFVGFFDTGTFGGVRNPDFYDLFADLSGITAIALILIFVNKNKSLKINPQE